MKCSWQSAAMISVLLASTACAGNEAANEAVNARERESLVNSTAGPTARVSNDSVEAKNAAAAEQPTQPAADRSILAWSRPAAGTTVAAPVNELVFHFTPPARLGEVTVTGPEGAMPMMVTAVGEVEHYSLPLSAAPGAYTVAWRATRQGRDYQGSFGFTVR